MTKASFLYHLVPNEMSGTVLYPLNELETSMPQVYSAQVAKYQGRPEVMLRRVPFLDCAWNDVLHFSPIHPQKVADGIRGSGGTTQPVEAFEVPFDALLPAQAVVLMFRDGRELFVPYTRGALADLGDLPEKTLAHYRERFSSGELPLRYAYAPHVLFRGSLETKDLERVWTD